MEEPLKRARDTARQRSLRIPLDYHRTRGAVGTGKMLLSLFGVLAGGLYVAWVLAGGKSAIPQISAGTLAKDHARWDNDCKACHAPFVPQRTDADGVRLLSLALSGREAEDVHRQTDAKCSDCHKSAGTHHANQFAAEVESCASCHRDHQGRDFGMTHMDDAHCTTCHASIAGHRTPQGSQGNSPIVNVTAFERVDSDGSGHPAFRSLQMSEDPGNIRFSHRLHMTNGQLYPGQKSPEGKRLVQLTCDACHQPETTTGNGAYMRPIKYEQHCRSCHPLSMPGQPAAVVPHGLASKQLENAVRGLATSAEAQLAKRGVLRIIPGKSKDDSDAGTKVPPEMQFDQRLSQLRENKCSQCHSWQEQNPVEVKPARIPSTWLQHARFSHQRHAATAKCQDCHPQATAKLPAGGVLGKLADDQQVMIPGIDNCVRCHAPRNESASTGGARFDCAECHRYHHSPVQEKTLRPSGSSSAADWAEPLRVTLVAYQQAASSPQKHLFVGTQSCSTTGCHGGTTKGRGSASAFTRFTADDPHERSFLLLYSDSSRRMVRRLRNKDQAEMSEPAYFAAIQDNCLGCHATPPADLTKSDRPQGYLAGVTCESCHGPAAEWEYRHFHPEMKPSGLPKLSDLSVRATACAECHIGPKEMLGKTYDVNHDLIAAGHPRLTFEFEAQSANLPAHWSPAKDIKSHFDAWKIGELATVEQQDKLYSWRNQQHAREGLTIPDFASHRCFDCHHALRPPVPLTRSAREGPYKAMPPQAQVPTAVRHLLTRPAPPFESPKNFLAQQLDAASNNPGAPGTRWEELVRFHLALSAFVADRPDDAGLIAANDNLRDLLANSFQASATERKMGKDDRFRGGPYDSPTGFDPNDPKLKAALDLILKNF